MKSRMEWKNLQSMQWFCFSEKRFEGQYSSQTPSASVRVKKDNFRQYFIDNEFHNQLIFQGKKEKRYGESSSNLNHWRHNW